MKTFKRVKFFVKKFKMRECVFCRIVKGEIPCEKVFESKDVLAFLDISPATEGHVLIVPKRHYETIFDIPENILGKIIKTAKEISELLRTKLNAEGINLLNSNNQVAQQEISHYHLHVIPRYSKDRFRIEFTNKTENKDIHKVAEKINK